MERFNPRWVRKNLDKPVQHIAEERRSETAESFKSPNPVSQKTESVPTSQTMFVKPTSSPREVIRVSALAKSDQEEVPVQLEPEEQVRLTSSVEMPNPTKRVQSGEAQEQVVSNAQRFDLRRIKTTDPPQRKSGKQCPECEGVQLELTADERKWRCPKCGFELKNRT